MYKQRHRWDFIAICDSCANTVMLCLPSTTETHVQSWLIFQMPKCPGLWWGGCFQACSGKLPQAICRRHYIRLGKVDLLFEKWAGQVTEVSFGYSSIRFKTVKTKDRPLNVSLFLHQSNALLCPECRWGSQDLPGVKIYIPFLSAHQYNPRGPKCSNCV